MMAIKNDISTKPTHTKMQIFPNNTTDWKSKIEGFSQPAIFDAVFSSHFFDEFSDCQYSKVQGPFVHFTDKEDLSKLHHC